MVKLQVMMTLMNWLKTGVWTESGGTSGSESSQRSPAQLDIMLSGATGKKTSSTSGPGFIQQTLPKVATDSV